MKYNGEIIHYHPSKPNVHGYQYDENRYLQITGYKLHIYSKKIQSQTPRQRPKNPFYPPRP